MIVRFFLLAVLLEVDLSGSAVTYSGRVGRKLKVGPFGSVGDVFRALSARYEEETKDCMPEDALRASIERAEKRVAEKRQSFPMAATLVF